MAGDWRQKLEQHSAIPIFPTIIWASQVRNDIAERINATILEQLEQAKTRQPELKPAGKWQTDQRLHTVPAMQEFRDLVLEGATYLLDAETIRYSGIDFTGCWANIGFPGSRHRSHAHPNNYLSGVYYVRAPEGGNTINFFDPRSQAAVVTPPSDRMTPLTAQKMTIDVKPGTLIFFPAWLTHSVDPNYAREERISVAFNLMFRDYVGTMGAPLWEGNLKVTPE